jgi:alpha-1,6-mannosyltransferase
MVLVGLSTWLMVIFNPDGSIGMYNVAHVAVAIVVSVVAALSLRTVDPLHLRSRRPVPVPAPNPAVAETPRQ